jgi:DNA polymerase-3 subunit epsilon
MLAVVRAAAETVLPAADPAATPASGGAATPASGGAATVASGGAATVEETERVLAWLERPETRLVELSAPWSSPVDSAVRFTGLLTQLERAPRPG